MYGGGNDLFIPVQNMYLHENEYSEPPREIDLVLKYLPEDIELLFILRKLSLIPTTLRNNYKESKYSVFEVWHVGNANVVSVVAFLNHLTSGKISPSLRYYPIYVLKSLVSICILLECNSCVTV